jgi:hypothetical protein
VSGISYKLRKVQNSFVPFKVDWQRKKRNSTFMADRGLAGFTAFATIDLQHHSELRAAVGEDSRGLDRLAERLLAASADQVSAADLEVFDQHGGRSRRSLASRCSG